MIECGKCHECLIKAECDTVDCFIDDWNHLCIHEMLVKIYNKGRADEREEWETAAGEMIMKYAGDIYEALPNVVKEIQTKAYQQGREDAIDEVIKECRDRTSHYLDGEQFKYMSELTDIAKYLKEKKDEDKKLY